MFQKNNNIFVKSNNPNELSYRVQGQDSQRGNRNRMRDGAAIRKSLPNKNNMKKEVDFVGINEQYYQFRNYNNVSQKSLSLHKKPFVLDGLKISESQKVLGPNRNSCQAYNGLGDKHLVHFFMKTRKRKDLIKNGVIDREGNITPSFVL